MLTASYLSTGEAARELGVLEAQLRRIARKQADLPRVRLGRTVGIDPAQLDAWRQALVSAGLRPATTAVP
jgi:hypothetical protein